MSDLSDTFILSTQRKEIDEMKLEEYKALVEAQRKASLAEALANLTKANEALTNTFNLLEENN
jgi:hypothetical protein